MLEADPWMLARVTHGSDGSLCHGGVVGYLEWIGGGARMMAILDMAAASMSAFFGW